MPRTIEVDDELYDFLGSHAEPFVDTPNSVIRRLVGLDAFKSAVAGFTSNGQSSAAAKAERPPQRRGSKKPDKKPRAPSGTLLPESEYELPLLRSLDELGGSGASRDVIARIGELIGDQLTAMDRQPLSSGGVRWQSRVQFVRLRLIERGLMEKNSPRGVWAITAAGKDVLSGSSK